MTREGLLKQIQRKNEPYRRIEELEKENAELRNNGFTVSAMTEQQLKVALEKGELLENENAELKKKVENLQKYLDTQNCYRECAETWLKLTEAKKLLKQFLEAKNGEAIYKAEWEAEQFLREIKENG